MNIEGLSEETLEKFIEKGYIQEFADLYHLDRHYEDIIAMQGFGEKSYEKLQKALEKSRKVPLHSLIYSLGIPNIGVANAKLICKAFQYDVEAIIKATPEELTKIDGIGEVMAEKFCEYFREEKNTTALRNLLEEVELEAVETNEEQSMEGLVFVVTGSVNHFPNRNAVKDYIEQRGGKVTGSVTSKTNYLINNDATSGSSKNKKAKELGIPIITEEEFLEMW